jgi:hypothetical protein
MNEKKLKRCYEIAAYSLKSRVRKKAIRRILDTVKGPVDYYFLLRRMVEFRVFTPDLWEFFSNFIFLERLASAESNSCKICTS